MSTSPAVHLVGALDTKGEEYAFVRDRLIAAGLTVVVVDTGVLAAPAVPADVSREWLAQTAGTSIATLAAQGDRAAAMAAMADSAARFVAESDSRGGVAGVIVLGGSNAGFVMSRIARALPFGRPKVLVSTVVAGDTRAYVGTSDLIMFYPVVDLSGLNAISMPVLAKAADAITGILKGRDVPSAHGGGLCVGCTMFGVTTTCVSAVQSELQSRGDQVQVFHATGAGGRGFEDMADAGAFDIMVDLTTTELADDLVGGVCSAGPERLTVAARRGIPQIVSVGAMDMVNFGPVETVRAEFTDRHLLPHNPTVTLMRTNPPENAELGRRIAHKLNASVAFAEVHVPARGFSQISVEGAPFHDPQADAELIRTLSENLGDHIPLVIHDMAINDPGFSTEILAAVDRAKRTLQKGT